MTFELIKVVLKGVVGCMASYGTGKIVGGMVDHAIEGQKMTKMGKVCVALATGAISGMAGKAVSDHVGKMFDVIKVDVDKNDKTVKVNIVNPDEPEEAEKPEEPEKPEEV